MLRAIQLHGNLAEQFGTEPIELDVDTPLLLISGLSCVIPGFEDAFRSNPYYQIVKIDKNNNTATSITEETFEMNLGSATDIHLVPTVEGSGFEIAGMIVAAGTAAYYAIGVVLNIAISMIMSSIAKALSPMPETSSRTTTAAAERPSFIFNQVINVTAPGNPVPLVYGECLTGSVVISVGVTTEQL